MQGRRPAANNLPLAFAHLHRDVVAGHPLQRVAPAAQLAQVEAGLQRGAGCGWVSSGGAGCGWVACAWKICEQRACVNGKGKVERLPLASCPQGGRLAGEAGRQQVGQRLAVLSASPLWQALQVQEAVLGAAEDGRVEIGGGGQQVHESGRRSRRQQSNFATLAPA